MRYTSLSKLHPLVPPGWRWGCVWEVESVRSLCDIYVCVWRGERMRWGKKEEVTRYSFTISFLAYLGLCKAEYSYSLKKVKNEHK